MHRVSLLMLFYFMYIIVFVFINFITFATASTTAISHNNISFVSLKSDFYPGCGYKKSTHDFYHYFSESCPRIRRYSRRKKSLSPTSFLSKRKVSIPVLVTPLYNGLRESLIFMHGYSFPDIFQLKIPEIQIALSRDLSSITRSSPRIYLKEGFNSQPRLSWQY